jgi:hypothetical protein
MRLQERDKAIRKYLRTAKWLTTEQIGRKFFPEKSLDPVRKRMRKLVSAKYLKSIQPNPMHEKLYALPETATYKNLQHLMLVNWLRMMAEEEQCDFFYAYWEFGDFEWIYPVIPDGISKINGTIFLLEVDSGTESLKQLKTKFANYNCFDFAYQLIVIADQISRHKKIRNLTETLIGQDITITTLTELS